MKDISFETEIYQALMNTRKITCNFLLPEKKKHQTTKSQDTLEY